MDINNSIYATLKILYKSISFRRKVQLLFLILLIIFCGFVELAGLGILIPFLKLLTDSEALTHDNWLKDHSQLFIQLEINPIIAFGFTFIIVVWMTSLFRILITWACFKWTYEIGVELSTNIFSRIVNQPFKYHTQVNSSIILGGLSKVHLVTHEVLNPLLQCTSSLVLSLFIFSAMLFVDIKITLIMALGIITTYFIISFFYRSKLIENSYILATTENVRIQLVQETLGVIRDIILENSQEKYINRYRLNKHRQNSAAIKSNLISVLPRYLMEGFLLSGFALFACIYSINNGSLVALMPTLAVLAVGSQKLLPLMQQLYSSWTVLSGNKMAMLEIHEFLSLNINQSKSSEASNLPFKRSLKLRDVSFSYDERVSQILKNINLEIRFGSRVGFIGSTGSGKSTLIDLIMGLIEPNTGEVIVDGITLSEKNINSWRLKISHVSQTIFLIDDSIMQNVILGSGDNEDSLERVRNALRKAELLEFVESLPNGISTRVGERGIKLSGGQRQRIAIARALYRNAKILIFDEATNALDIDTENAIIETINKLGNIVTILFITHRVSMLSICDEIYKINNGTLETVEYKNLQITL
jgi:ABC-type bacteriocin/lantibiotic exporter with double-glycine peptidase domain